MGKGGEKQGPGGAFRKAGRLKPATQQQLQKWLNRGQEGDSRKRKNIISFERQILLPSLPRTAGKSAFLGVDRPA